MPSTAIRAINYDAPRRRLRVTFVSGAVYDYEDVPPETVEAFRAAPSKGRFFAYRIRPKFTRFRKVERGDSRPHAQA
jgi:hypothetical protein